MRSIRAHNVAESWSAYCWSWLALIAMLLPLTGWQASAQSPNLGIAGRTSDEGENEFPGEDEGGDSANGDLEAHLLFRRQNREDLPPGTARETSAPLMAESDSAWFARAPGTDRVAAESSAAQLRLRC
jgi:hypothetical protein